MVISCNAVEWLTSSSGLASAIPIATFTWRVVLRDWNQLGHLLQLGSSLSVVFTFSESRPGFLK